MSTILLQPEKLSFIRTMDKHLVSYNIEMTEITGGTFWKPYTKEQIDGTKEFPKVESLEELAQLMAVFPPANLYNNRLRELAKALGPVYIRVSGSWATTTYYDFDGHTNGTVPEGFKSILTKEQWIGVLDFVKYVGGKLMISVANCDGVHKEDGSWNPEQAKMLFDFSKEYGVPICAAEFMNEPNTAMLGGGPTNYTLEAFCRHQDEFYRFVRENYPEVLIIGPCACGDPFSENVHYGQMRFWSSKDLLEGCKETSDVFSYHMYHGISERGAAMGKHWDSKDAISEEYLAVPYEAATFYGKLRDEYCNNAPMWVTESADAGCGGNTWASTFMDIIRSADELGRFCTVTDGVIFHNTLMASDYAYLDRETHLPRPNYWLALLWNQLVGQDVYDTKESIREGVHMYTHSRKDGKDGFVYIIINNSKTTSTVVDVPTNATKYVLSATHIRSSELLLNGRPLTIENEYDLPNLEGEVQQAGELELPPETVTFLVI